jgi:hypothetical protein
LEESVPIFLMRKLSLKGKGEFFWRRDVRGEPHH